MIITISKVEYLGGYRLRLFFNTEETGVIDLQELVHRAPLAAPLRDQHEFQRFYLDDWPTVVWPCGFDLAPEYAYRLATGKSLPWEDTVQ